MKFNSLILILFLSACSTDSKYISGVNYDRNKSIINKVLEINRKDILYPDDVSSINLDNLPSNYSYKLVEKYDNRKNEIEVIRLIKYNGKINNAHYFIYHYKEHSGKSPIEYTSHFKLEDGRKYYYHLVHKKYVEEDERNCFFTLGGCSYTFTRGSGGESKVETNFNNGLWVTTRKAKYGSIKYLRAFDEYGLTLFRLSLSLNAKNASYQVREQINKEELQFINSIELKL